MAEKAQKQQNIPELFNGKCVLVTGATGFLGKVLVEKLLRSCPGIRELFILLRPSENHDAGKRFQNLLDNQVFDRLRKEQPDALHKIRLLNGDVTFDNLGLNESQLRKLTNDVSFIFHCAADIRFDDKPRTILSVNLLGVKNVLHVSKLCQKLEALVHVSTAFSFCNHPEISEQLYSEVPGSQEMIATLMWVDDNPLQDICAYYGKGRPSLYHLSKALSERLIVETGRSLPIIIVRPSIVTASAHEPFPGWIDNYNGPSGFIVMCGKGIVKTLLVKQGVNADWVPVDTVANTLIVAAHYIAVKRKNENPDLALSAPNEVPIINCTCPEENSITWSQVVQICLPFLIQYPSREVYGKPGGTVTSCPFRYAMCRLVSHYIPAFFVDASSYLLMRKPGLISKYRKIHRVMATLEHYTTHGFIFHSENMKKLNEQMVPEDRILFPIDLCVLDWTRYIENYVLGVRRYFLKEKDETLPEARAKMMRVHYFWLAMKCSSAVGFLLVIYALKEYRLKIFNGSFVMPSFPFISIAFIRNKLGHYLRK